MSSVKIDNASEGNSAALSFRCATVMDIARVVTLVALAYSYRGEASRRIWTNEADLLDGRRTDHESMRALIESSQSLIVLAERAGQVIACAHIRQRGELCFIAMVSVCPELQGAGVGGAVVSECERFARASWGCRAMELTVIRQRDDLIAWYERRGYRRTGETRPFPYGDERFRPRRRDLEFVVLQKPLRAAEMAEVMAGHSEAISC
ncbi:MAG TPA: GNAT family N-acetyltransferase [Polyangium sp.]|nr:GNAT family N-acetyltransferase [Polyangium sp.]